MPARKSEGNSRFGNFLEKRASELTLNLRTIVDILKISPGTLTNWRQGKPSSMSIDMLFQLASILRCSPFEIMYHYYGLDREESYESIRIQAELLFHTFFRLPNDQRSMSILMMNNFIQASGGRNVTPEEQNAVESMFLLNHHGLCANDGLEGKIEEAVKRQHSVRQGRPLKKK